MKSACLVTMPQLQSAVISEEVNETILETDRSSIKFSKKLNLVRYGRQNGMRLLRLLLKSLSQVLSVLMSFVKELD